MMLRKYTLVSQCIHAEEEDKGNDRQADTERLIPNNTAQVGASHTYANTGAAPSSLVSLSALHLQRLHDAGMASGLGPS